MDRRSAEFSCKLSHASPSSIKQQKQGSSSWALSVRQEIPPAANAGRYAADWLQDFAGFSWFAYGASTKLVISVAPSPSDKDDLYIARLFQQVIDPSLVQAPVGDPNIFVVNWSSKGGFVAAAAGNVIYVLAPKSLAQDGVQESPVLPFGWEPTSLLVQSSSVSHFMWTASGDGMLVSIGFEVIMWKQKHVTDWEPVWQFQVQIPQTVVASTWSCKGLAASADDNLGGKQKGKATVWWWEEGMDLQATELSHPRELLGIQWRPVRLVEGSSQQHRPILLTTCADGVVRLWLEIDSGKARSDKQLGKEVPESSLKLAFFVSAVIEVNTSLQGTLGLDCFIIWASEADTALEDVAPCEWIVGIRAGRGVTLWSLHCLDDIYPSRCPRVLLWRQGTCRSVDSSQDVVFQEMPSQLKGVIKRPRTSAPPAALDLFQVYEAGFLRWSRIWPPVLSIGGAGSRPGSLDSNLTMASATWGCSSHEFYVDGHIGDTVKLALHPIRTTSLAASADEKRNAVLLWRTGTSLEPSLEIPSFHMPAWKLCGRICTLREVPSICWSPAQLPGEKSLLFVTHSKGVYCYFISWDKGAQNRHVCHEMVYEFRVPPSAETHIEAISCVLPNPESPASVVLVAFCDGGRSILSWRLHFDGETSDIKNGDTDSLEQKAEVADISSTYLGQLCLESGERLVTTLWPYGVVSGCEDGSVRLRIFRGSEGWKCAGLLEGHSGRPAHVAVDEFGMRIASTSVISSRITIWEIISSLEGYIYTCTGEIYLPDSASALSWFEGGYGLPLLAVATGFQVQVYVDGRSEGCQVSDWLCLASVSLPSHVSGVSWATRGRLLACAGSQVFILSYWLFPRSVLMSGKRMEQLLVAAEDVSRSLSYCHPSSIMHLLKKGEQFQVHACLRYLLSHVTEGMESVPFVRVGDLWKSADSSQNASAVRTWEFGKVVEEISSETMSGSPLTGSELRHLVSAVKELKEGPELLAIIRLLEETNQLDQLASLDPPGQRFVLELRYNRLLAKQKNCAGGVEFLADSKSIAWALQSECKEELIDMLIPGNVSWPAFRSLGAGYWFTNVGQLRTRIEKLARAQFLETRDPKDCALFYVAIDRKNVLSGLLKLSKDEKDRPLVEFFARNFQEEKNKSAALKNAYVLLGKHRFELAAAFFLLGGDLYSAVSVCYRNVGDPQLALTICRLMEGDNTKIARDLIQMDLLPDAKLRDKWLASLLQCLLAERLEGVYELIGKGELVLSAPELDPDIGDYCNTIFSKPGMATDTFATTKASQISVLSLRKHGLPLLAADILRKVLPTDVAGDTSLSNNHVLLGEQTAKRLVEESVLQYLRQLAQQHSKWSLDIEPTSNGVALDTFFQELILLQKKFDLTMASTILSLAKMSWHYGRPYFGRWLLDFVQASFSSFARDGCDEETLGSLTATAPDALCTTLLICGSAACPLLAAWEGPYKSVMADMRKQAHIRLLRSEKKIWNGVGAQIDGLVGYARQVKEFAGTGSRANSYILLALVICLEAAWLKRQAKVLLVIFRMMMDARLLHSAFDLNPCFVGTELDDSKGIGSSISSFCGIVGSPISDEDGWQVLGVVLWSQALSLSRKHLGGVAQVSYSGFGRVSPRHSTIESLARMSSINSTSPERTKTGATEGIGSALLSSLSCICSKLRRQLGLRMTGSSPAEPLHILLWSSGPSNDDSSDNSPFLELWKLLSVREEARSALRLEGLDPAKRKPAGWVNAESLPEAAPSETSKETPLKLAKSFSVKGLIQGRFNTRFLKGEEVLRLSGDMVEAIAVNACDSEQVVISSNHKGLVYLNLDTGKAFAEAEENLWSEADWPRNGWAGSVSTPLPTFVSPGVGLGSKGGSGIGLGGAAVGLGALPGTAKKVRSGSTGFGVPGYAGMAAWNMGWEEVEDFEDSIDPPATLENVSPGCIASHPLRPFFLVGARNTHVYLWKFGTSSATATYGVLPAANVPPPYALASVSSVQFDRCGHRFASAAVDGTVCTWQLEVGGRSNVCPTESCLCFDNHAADVAFLAGSGAVVAAAGLSKTGENLAVWNTLAPSGSAIISVACHEGGARCLDTFDYNLGGSPLIVSGGKAGDICIHDFRSIASGKSKRKKSGYQEQGGAALWRIPKAHSASVTKVRAVPGTSMFLSCSKDGDVKLWDVNKSEMVHHWQQVHQKHTFLQPNARGFGALVQAAVTDVRVLGDGFVTCGGDGVVRRFRHQA